MTKFSFETMNPTFHGDRQEQGWSWLTLENLKRLLDRDPQSILDLYCEDARAAMQEETWNGENWLFATYTNNSITSGAVWDMKTGRRLANHIADPQHVFLPAGWPRIMFEESRRLDLAARAAIDMEPREGSHEQLEQAIAPLTYKQFMFVTSQLKSTPNALKFRISEEPEESKLVLSIAVGDSRSNSVIVEIRLLFGRLRVLGIRRTRHDN